MQRTSRRWTPWRRFFAAAVAFTCAGCGSEPDRPPPNVILMVIDTLRADHLGGYGYFRDTTPVLDTLIEEGVRFDAAIAPGSWSPPSQISIITGVNPYLHGVNDFGHRIRSPIDPLGTILKRHGYATGLFSSHRALHTSVERSTEGMDHQFVALDRDREVLEDAADFALSARPPLFLYICLTTPHAPYDRYPEKYNSSLFTDTPPGGKRQFRFTKGVDLGKNGIPIVVRIGNRRDAGFYINRYDRAVRHVDTLVGEFWKTLKSAGLTENTVLVVTSDHGEGLGENAVFAHEYFFYDFLVRVPLIVRFPAQIRGGETWAQQVALIDIVPTILGLAGISVPEALEGSDLSEDLIEQSRPDDPPLVAGSYIARGERRFMVRSQNQKLVFDSKGNREELYDLLLDPTESSNEIGSKNKPLYADEYAELEEVMARTIAAYEVLEEDQTRQLSPELKQDLRALGYAE